MELLSGVTNRKVKVLDIFDCTKDEELLAKAFCKTAIITKPGTKKFEYGIDEVETA